MKNINERNYSNISDAVAFVVRFAFMVYGYDDIAPIEFYSKECTTCGKNIQSKDLLVPKSSFKKEYGVTSLIDPVISDDIKKALIDNFDISENDFRPVYTKKGELVCWQITPKSVLMPMISVNRIRQLKPCRKCGRVQYRINEYTNDKGYFYYYMTKDALEAMSDINRTYEEYNGYRSECVVSRRVYEYLIERYPRMIFEPIFLKE